MLVEFDGYRPQVADDAFIAPTAVLIGNVRVDSGASVWFGAILRGDHGSAGIVVGAGSNVQDNCVIHVSLDAGTTIGKGVTVGHGALLEACTVNDEAVIGMGAVVLEGVTIGARSLVGANSTVLAGTAIPPGVLAAGSPAAVKKAISGNAAWWIGHSSDYYVELGRRYRDAGVG